MKKNISNIVLLLNIFFKTLLTKILHIHCCAKNKKVKTTSLSFLDAKSHLFVSNIGAEIFKDFIEQAISDFEINAYSRTGKKN